MRPFRWVPCLTLLATAAWAQAPVITTGSNLGTWTIGEVQAPLAAAGGNGAFIWSLAGGTLPTGVTLRTDVPSFFPAGTAAGLIGVATAPGTYNFTLSVTSAGNTVSQPFNVKVTAFGSLESVLPDAFVGLWYSYALGATNNAGAVTWALTGFPPPGIALSSDGVLSGYPWWGSERSYNFSFSMNDGTDTIVKSFALTISPVEIYSGGMMGNATLNTPYIRLLVASDGPVPSCQGFPFCSQNRYYSVDTLPPGLSLDSVTGVVSGSATGGLGPWNLIATVIDTASGLNTFVQPPISMNQTQRVSKQMTIDVLAPPVTAGYVSPPYGLIDDCTMGVSCSRNIDVRNGGTAPYSWTAAGLPPGMGYRTGSDVTLSWIGVGNLELWGTPTAVGTYNVRVTVTDANGLATSESFAWNVSNLGMNSGDYLPNGTRGTAYAKTLRILGGSGTGYAATLTAGRLPAGVTLSGMVVSGTPTEDGSFREQFSFTDSAGNTFKVTNNFNIDPALNVNFGPVNIYDNWDLGQVLINGPYLRQLTACCGTMAWAVAAGSLPPGITLSADGLLSGAPTTSGTYAFTIVATDTSTTNASVRAFQLVVTPLTVITGLALPYGNVGSFYSQTIHVTGASGALTFILPPGNFPPPGLTLNSTSGILSGTPVETGQFSFRITVTDTARNIITRTFQVFMFAPGIAPPVGITTGANLGTWSTGPRDTALFSTGGNGLLVWSLVSGALPPGIVLRNDFPSFFLASSTGDLSGVATTPGNYSFTLQASSGGQVATQTFTVRVTALVAEDYYALPDASTGLAYSYTLTALNNAGPVTWTATGLPPGITANPATGVLSGTPAAAGFYSITLTLNDGVDTVTPQFSLSMNVFAIQITSGVLLPSPTQFVPYSTTVTASGGTPPYTFTASGLPAGLSLNASTGTLSGSTTQTAGRFPFTLTVTDSVQVSRGRNANLVVLGSPARLVELFPYGSFDDCSVGAPCTRGIGAQSGGTPPFTFSATGLPPGMSIRSGAGTTEPYVSPNDGEIWGIAATAGTYNVHIIATDANGNTATQTFPLTVSELFIQGADGLPTGTRGTVYSANLRVTGGSPAWSVIQIGGTLPAGLTLSGMTVSGTPAENGFFSPVFLFSDGAGHQLRATEGFAIGGGSATIGIDTSANLGPITVNASYSSLLSACCVASYTWSLVSGTLPPGLTFAASGLLSGTPTTAGAYTFLIKAADQVNAANFGVRQFTAIVTPMSIPTSGSLVSGNAGTFYAQSFVAAGGTGTVTWGLAPFNYLPPGMTLTSGGLLSGTPTSPGQYFFTLIATDTAGNTFSRFCSVSFYPPGVTPPLGLNFGPVIGPNTIGVFTFQLTASGGVPPYRFSSAGATGIPGMRVLDGPPLPTSFPSTTTGGFAGVVTAPGFYTATLRVTDAALNTLDRPISWTVLNTAPLSESSLPKATVGTPYSFTFGGYGGSGNLSWSSLNLPAGLSIGAGGTISGTPTIAGTASSTVTLTDPTNNTSLGFTETVTVNPFAIATGGVLPPGQISSPYSQTLTAPNCGSGCTWTVAGGSLPSGMALTLAGVISGTPASFYNSGFLAQAAGTNGTVQKELSLRIDFNTIQPLFISQAADFGTAALSGPISSALNVQGGAPPYVWSLDSGSLPPGIRLTGPGETVGANLMPGFTYLAGRAMQVGNYHFTLKVTDGASSIATQAFTWSVPPLLLNILSFPTAGNPLLYNTAYSQQLLALGGSGIYTSWAIASGSLPPGMSLNASTGTVSGTPANTGSFTAGIQVTDTLGNTATQNVTFTGAGQSGVVIHAGNPDVSTAAAGATSIFGWSPSGGTGPYTYSAITAIPPGCAFEFGNTILANDGNPYSLVCTPLGVGDFTFTFQVSDAAGNFGVRTMTLHVTAFNLFSSSALPNAAVGSPYSQTILTWDNSSAVTWTVAAGSLLPPGLIIAAGALSGTPAVAGNYSFALTASDAGGLTLNYTFTLLISTIHITNPDIVPAHAIFGVPFTYTFTATGGGNPKTWTATGLLPGITMSTTGTLSGTITSAGTFRITVTVTDGASSFVRAFTLFADHTDPDLPGYAPAGLTLADARLGASVSYPLSPTGGTAPFTWSVAAGSVLPGGLNFYSGSTLSAYSSGQTTGLTYLQGAASIAGSYSFDLIATDAAGVQMRRTFTLRVSSMAILAGALRTPVTGVPYAAQLMVVGGTPPYTFAYSLLGINTDLLPQGLTASSSGFISGTPASVGNFGFFATAQDSLGQTYTGSYSYIVTNSLGVNITTPIPFGLSAGTGYSALLATSGASNYTWSIAAGTPPPGLSLIPSGSSTVLAGAPSTPGTYTYTLRAVENANAANIADRVFTVPVSPMQYTAGVNVPANYLPPARAGSSYTYTYKIAGGTPPYTFTTVPSIYPLPAGLALSPAGVLSGTPRQNGSFLVYFVLSDSAGSSGRVFAGNLNVLGAGQIDPVQGLTVALHAATAGSPYAVTLDTTVKAGIRPFTWSVAAGSNLPAGIAILAGSNGVSSYLGGIPTTTGSYSFALQATDAAGQTAITQNTLTVSPILVTPDELPNGTVGSPYATTLTAIGGTGPYTFQFSTGSSVPPGVTLSAAGVLSGTPSAPGYFSIDITVTDSASNSAGLVFPVAIDAAGAAQGIGISPSSTIRMNYAIGAPAPSPLPITISATSGTLGFTAMVSGIPGATLSAASGTAAGTVNLSLNTAGAVAGTYAGVLAVSAPLSANLTTRIPVVLTVTGTASIPVLSIAKSHTGNFTQGQNGATYTVTVSNGAGAGPASGTVTVTETMPSGLTLASMAGTGWTCAAGAVTCTRSDLLNGGVRYPAITVTVNVALNAGTPLTNSVSVSGGGSAGSGIGDSTVINASLASVMNSPTPGTTLSATSVTFAWNSTAGADQYWLDVGTSPGNGDISAVATSGTSLTSTGLPCDGRTLYVQLYTHLNSTWQVPQRYTYTAPTGCVTAWAKIVSPAPLTTLSATSATFTWNAAAGADQYWLDVGTSPGDGSISAAATTGISLAVTGLPCDGRTLYVQLYTHVNGNWQAPQRYTYTATRGCFAQIVSPAPLTTLSATSATFTWNVAAGADQYWLDVGTSPGNGGISATGTTGTSLAVTGLPCDGRTLYVQLYTHVNGSWQAPQRYTYTALTGCVTPWAQIVSPLPLATLSGTSATFSWNAAAGADQYWLDVGSSSGNGGIWAGATTLTSKTVAGLPCDGRTLYVQLYTHAVGAWQAPQRYTYLATSSCNALFAQMVSPAPLTALSGTSVTFSWNAAASADQYWLDVGSSPGNGGISAGATTNTSKTVTGLPCDGRTLYVQLYTHVNSAWQAPQRYTYTAPLVCTP